MEKIQILSTPLANGYNSLYMHILVSFYVNIISLDENIKHRFLSWKYEKYTNYTKKVKSILQCPVVVQATNKNVFAYSNLS